MLPHTIKSDAQTIEELLSMGCTSSKAIPNEVQVIDKVVNALEKDKEEKYVKVNVDVEVETSDDQPNNHINKSTNTFDSAEYEYIEDVIAKKKAKDTMNQKPAAVSSNTNTKEKKRQLFHQRYSAASGHCARISQRASRKCGALRMEGSIHLHPSTRFVVKTSGETKGSSKDSVL